MNKVINFKNKKSKHNSKKKDNESSSIIQSLSQEEIDLRKVFIDRVPGKITKKDIEEEFSKHGPLLEVVKYQDRKDSKRHYAFVLYRYPEDCAKSTSNPTHVKLEF